MSLKEDILQQIEDYLNHSLSDKERLQFETQISQDAELSELVSLNKDMRDHYNDETWPLIDRNASSKRISELEDYFKSDLGKSDKALLQRVKQTYSEAQNVSRKKPFNYRYMAIAASFLLLVGYFIFRGPSNANLYDGYNNWNELPSLTTKGTVNETLLSKGEDAFVNKNYEAAKTNFETYLKENPTINTNVLLYYGLSQLELNDTKNALATFDKLITSNTIDSSKGYWYKAMVYLKRKDFEKVKEQLEIISQNPKNFNYKKALEVLKKIKS